MKVPKTWTWALGLSTAALVLFVGVQLAVPLMAKKESNPAPAPAPGAPVAPATLAKLFDEAEEAFVAQEYNTAATKLTELLKLCNNKPEYPMFNVGLARLLQNNAPEAEKAFGECLKTFPKGEYTSRCYLGIGKAASAQGGEEKKQVAIEAFKKAAADPKFRTEAGLALGQVYIDKGQKEAALTLFRGLVGADIRTPQQTAAAVEVIGLLAKIGPTEDLEAYLDHVTAQPGVRDAIAWFSNQVVVKGDTVVAEAGELKEKWEAALAIYRSVPPQAQILEIQTAGLETQRKELEELKRRQEAESKSKDGLRQRSNVGELITAATAALKQMEEAKQAIEGMKDFDAALLMRRGRCCYYLQRREEALMCFATIREKHPGATDAQAGAYAEIVVYNELKDNNKIQALADAFMAKYPQAANIEMVATLAGEVLVAAGDWPKVQSFYEDLATRFPQSPNLDRFRFYIAVAVFQRGDFEKAAGMLEQFLKDFPNADPAMKEAAEARKENAKILSK